MKIPNFIETKVVDENGFLTAIWKQILTQLISQLQLNLSDEGIMVPQQTSANIALLNTVKSTGAIVYDKDTNEFKVNISGTFKVVQVI